MYSDLQYRIFRTYPAVSLSGIDWLVNKMFTQTFVTEHNTLFHTSLFLLRLQTASSCKSR